MARGELENRDADELGVANLPGIGELSEELAEERGELDSYSTRQLTGEVPADVQAGNAALDQARRTGIGSPNIDYQVRSTFDSRPVHGKDFNLWFGCLGADGVEVDKDHLQGLFRRLWQVPRGLVAVIRGITIRQEADETFGIFDGQLELLVDGVAKDPTTVQTGPDFNPAEVTAQDILYQSGEEIETFALADEGMFVGLLIDPELDLADYTNKIYAGFRGTFLQKTGVPYPFQIANKAGQAYTARTVSADSLSGADLLKRRRKAASPYQRIPLVNAPK